MTLTTSVITGRCPFPDDTVPDVASLRFVLSGVDTQGADVLHPAERVVDLVAGAIPAGFDLWKNTLGDNLTHYEVFLKVVYQDPFGVMTQAREYRLGTIQIGSGATYQLADLLVSPVANMSIEAYISQIMTAAGNAATDADRAETAADAAGQSADRIDLGSFDADVAATAAHASDANTAKVAAQAAQTGAVAAQSAAVAARDLAFVNANVYASTAAGLAAVAVGGQFSVISGVDLVRYRVDAGPVATEVLRMNLNDAAQCVPVAQSGTTPPYKPNFDRASQVLTLYADTVIFIRNAPQEYVVPATINIDTTNGGALVTGLRRVYFRSSDNTFVVRAWNTDMAYADVATHHLIAVIRHGTTATAPETTQISMNCELTIDKITDPIQPAVLHTVILGDTAGYIPNLDTAANTLYLPSGMSIIAAGPLAQKAKRYITPTPSVYVDLTVAASIAKAVYYSISTATYVVKDASQNLTGAEISDLLLIAGVMRSTGTGFALSMTCPCTVDGAQQLMGLDEKQGDWAAIATPLDGATPLTSLPEYNRTTKTLTFWSGTVFLYQKKRWVTTARTDIVINTALSSLHRIYWNTKTNTLISKIWSTDLTRLEAIDCVLVATIRDTPYSTLPPTICMTVPYTVDGKLLGYINDYAGTGAENRRGAAIEGVHHRGSPLYAPENTLASFKYSARLKTFTVECDVAFTSDNVAVLLHDETIDRTSDGTGRIDSMTLATAKTYDFGSWKNAAYTGERIPTWAEMLLLAKQLNLHVRAEVKPNATLAQVQSLLTTMKQLGISGKQVMFTSFHQPVLQKIVAEDPTQDVAFLIGAATDAQWTAAIATVVADYKKSGNAVWIETNGAGLTKARVDEAHMAGVKITFYVADTPTAVMNLADMGIDAIGTDVLPSIAQVLRDQVLA